MTLPGPPATPPALLSLRGVHTHIGAYHILHGVDLEVPEGEVTLYHPKGCSHCSGTGYRGRLSIMEMLPMTDRLRSLVMRHANSADLRAAAIEDGMEPMFDNGIRKAAAGVTTIEEVLRVTRED
jgi:general secretion pathway protein E